MVMFVLAYLTSTIKFAHFLRTPLALIRLCFCLFWLKIFFLDMLVLSDLHGASSVRALALKFIVENGKEIVAQDGWRDKLKVRLEHIVWFLHKGRDKKKVWNFPYFSKPTHPTHLVWKKMKITWSKNHFWAKISILAKNYFFPIEKVQNT